MPDHLNPQTGEPATHHLPWTNGWSSHWSLDGGQERPTTWCGHCKASIPVTEEWVKQYYDKQTARFDHRVFCGYVSPRDEAYGREQLEKDRQSLLRLIRNADARLEAIA